MEGFCHFFQMYSHVFMLMQVDHHRFEESASIINRNVICSEVFYILVYFLQDFQDPDLDGQFITISPDLFCLNDLLHTGLNHSVIRKYR